LNLHRVEKGYVGITNVIGEKEMATPEKFPESQNEISIKVDNCRCRIYKSKNCNDTE